MQLLFTYSFLNLLWIAPLLTVVYLLLTKIIVSVFLFIHRINKGNRKGGYSGFASYN